MKNKTGQMLVIAEVRYLEGHYTIPSTVRCLNF